jgi:hypothetical protein
MYVGDLAGGRGGEITWVEGLGETCQPPVLPSPWACRSLHFSPNPHAAACYPPLPARTPPLC